VNDYFSPMKRREIVLWAGPLLFAALLLIGSCSEDNVQKDDKEEKSAQSKFKMAEESELALLMRQLTEETEAIQAAIEAGEEHPLWTRVRDLHTATPTDATSSGPVFEGFVSAFIGSVEEMQAADTNHTKYYNAVIDRCMDCHATYCPGPMKRIEKFYVSN